MKAGSAEEVVNRLRKRRGLPQVFNYGLIDYKHQNIRVFGYLTETIERAF
jgi:hypothetical protein